MKLYILNDIHVEFEAFDPPAVDADVVILAGDIHVKNKGLIWAQEKFNNIPVLYVMGNHEYYGETLQRHLKKIKEQAHDTNINILENESITINDVTFLCCTLWTDFQLFGDSREAANAASHMMADFRVIRIDPTFHKLSPLDTVKLHKQSLKWLKSEIEKYKNHKLVIITHHAPSRQSISKQYKDDILSAAFASELHEFVVSSGAKLWIHGHVHNSNDYMIGNTRVLCNPRGYPNEYIEGFIPDLVIEI